MRHNIILKTIVFVFSCIITADQKTNIENLAASALKKHSHCGTIPYPSNTGNVTPAPIIKSPHVWNFVSEPNLHPMKVTVITNKPKTNAGLIFLAPYAFSANASIGQQGTLILDNKGIPFWFRPLKSSNLMNTDFRVQTLYGKPVLTFWQGTLATPPTYTNTPAGSSEAGSCYYILDNTYRVKQTVTAHKGFISDIHEFLITPDNTALLLSTKTVPMDLTPFGGPQNGYVQDFAIQEIDLATNKLIFFWDALDHISLDDSFEPASSATSSGNIWDAYHLNSIGLTDKKDEIIFSSRNTWTIYRIKKSTGKIVWRLGGKQSDFTFEQGAAFSWQHDARLLPHNIISMFNDNCCESDTVPPGTPPSHGLILQLNFKKMTAKVKRTYFHNPNLNVSSQGNVQTLENDNRFIGWGQSQYYAEYAPEGNTANSPSVNTLYDAKMPGNNYTYRAYKHEWLAKPHYPPKIAVRSNRSIASPSRAEHTAEVTVYASWNGSTETAYWQVYAGRCKDTLEKITTADKKGFETAICVNNCGPYFQVKALDWQCNVIGQSQVVKL